MTCTCSFPKAQDDDHNLDKHKDQVMMAEAAQSEPNQVSYGNEPVQSPENHENSSFVSESGQKSSLRLRTSPKLNVKSQLRMQIGYSNHIDFGEKEAAVTLITREDSQAQQMTPQ